MSSFASISEGLRGNSTAVKPWPPVCKTDEVEQLPREASMCKLKRTETARSDTQINACSSSPQKHILFGKTITTVHINVGLWKNPISCYVLGFEPNLEHYVHDSLVNIFCCAVSYSISQMISYRAKISLLCPLLYQTALDCKPSPCRASTHSLLSVLLVQTYEFDFICMSLFSVDAAAGQSVR